MPKGHTITADVYCEQLDRVQKALNEKREHCKKTLFLHDNATPDKAKKTKNKLEKLGWTVVPHPPYSPDLATTNYKLFRSLQNALKEKEFKTVKEIRMFIKDFLASKPSVSLSVLSLNQAIDGKNLSNTKAITYQNKCFALSIVVGSR
uniref:Transposase n=1 Tax=Ditylenchus dipsaci TaxID=166011 RepID=A0A915DJH4_9BILA